MMIPVAILESPGKLDSEQTKIMRKHVVHTGEIAHGVIPDDVVSIAVRHHEKLDGSGYPDGLKAQELSTSDRILAVADIISALNSKRSYKEQYGREKTLSILNRMAGDGQLDREIVNTVNVRYDEMQRRMAGETAPVIRIYETMKSEYVRLMS